MAVAVWYSSGTYITYVRRSVRSGARVHTHKRLIIVGDDAVVAPVWPRVHGWEVGGSGLGAGTWPF